MNNKVGKVRRPVAKGPNPVHSPELDAKEVELQKTIQQLRESQKELEASRNTYAFLYDSAPVGYVTFDRDGVILSVNQTGEALLGHHFDDLVQHQFERFIAVDDRSIFADFLRDVFTGQRKETCRVQLMHPEQRQLFVRIEAKVTDQGNECLAVLVDITEKKQAEQALAQSEYNLAKAQAMTHVGSWSFEPATGKVVASSELLRILRLSEEQATQENFASVVHPEDQSKVIGHLQSGIELGRSYEIEHRLRFETGEERWVYSIIEPQVNSFGRVLKLYGTTQDITARKRAEVELRNITNELQAIFDSIGDAILVYDQNARVQHYNVVSKRLLPVAAQIGRPCAELFHRGSAADANNCPVERALRGERIDSSLTLTLLDKNRHYLDVTTTPIFDAHEGRHRALVFLRDVSEKRMQELHLVQTEKLSSIGVLATGIAHEINNPLSSIAGFAEALERRFRDELSGAKDPRLDIFPPYLKMITTEVYRCKDIINHLLSFGRKSEGVSLYVDINQILLEVMELLKYHALYRHTQVEKNLQENLPRIKADPSGLRQVCMNLLINAYQSLEEGGKVEVSTRSAAEETIEMVISDNGCGMSDDIVDRIWEPFYTTKEVGSGTGLGLAITYNIIKEHGGNILLNSRLGEGSEFIVRLPASLR